MNYIFKAIKLIYISFAVFGLSCILFWIFIDNKPPVELYGEGSAYPKEVSPGDYITISWMVDKKKTCNGVSVKSLFGECGAHLLRIEQPPVQEMDGPGIARIVIRIPEEALNGKCEFQTTNHYNCNPLQYLFPTVYKFPPVKFIVK